MLATAAHFPSIEDILIGPGSVLDLDKLKQEIVNAGPLLEGKAMVIHPQAAIRAPRHLEAEQDLVKIGSTMKGTAAAAAEKMMRDPEAFITAGGMSKIVHEQLGPEIYKVGMSLSLSSSIYDRTLDRSRRILVEGSQGASLSMHSNFYPYCTSRDVSTYQTLADCRLPMDLSRLTAVVGVCRTYPIRVANRKGPYGEDCSSGGYYSDQRELEWAEIHREPELTTVTKLPRRLFSFSGRQFNEAYRQLGVTHVALTFCDYLTEEGQVPEEGDGPRIALPLGAVGFIDNLRTLCGAHLTSVSFGPKPTDIYSIDKSNNLDQPAFIGEF
jgi:adenylosuccinate synthase